MRENILVLNYEYPPLGGGGGVAAKKLAEAWVTQGYNVDYVTTWVEGLEKQEEINGVNVYRVPVLGKRNQANAGMLSLLSFPLCAHRQASRLCRSRKYKFVNTHFAVPTGPLGASIAGKFKIPNILSLHGGDIYDPTKKFSPHKWFVLRMCIKYVLNHSDCVVAQSGNTKENTQKYYPSKKDIKIIPLPYDMVEFEPAGRGELGLDEGATYLVSVGRLVRRKGYDNLIRALARIKDEHVKLVILGEGPERDNLEAIAAEKNLGNRVIMPGFVSESRKFQYLSCSDIYVLSSIHEGFGIVIQEAMQAGLPIVATNYGGQVDIVKDGENGLLAAPGSPEALAEGIERLLGDRALMEKMRRNNLAKITRYSSDAIAAEYVRCAEECADNMRKR